VLGHVLFSTSILAAAISFHNTIARYVFALGREHALPAVFGRTSTSGAPPRGLHRSDRDRPAGDRGVRRGRGGPEHDR
jgi:hypothetical protein